MEYVIVALGVIASVLLGRAAGRAGLGGGKKTKLSYGIGFWGLLAAIVAGFFVFSLPKSLFLALGLVVLTVVIWFVTAGSKIGRAMRQSEEE